MISVSNLSLRYGKRTLFDEVNLKFTAGNCYGIIGANGAGKSTFLKILSGDVDPTTGAIEITPGERMAVLRQNHFEYDEFPVIETVIMGHKKLYEVIKQKEILYAKADFTEEDGHLAGELEGLFAEMNGWDAESDAAELLSHLGIKEDYHYRLMKELTNNEKVRVLLAQALFGNPDVLILDEPTNDLDLETAIWLEDFLADFKNTVIVVSHDRHFLDMVCTHVCDIDFGKIQLFTGNYTFWYEMSQLLQRQQSQKNKKDEQKRQELMEFIQRFSANASKSKQATSRKKALEKLNIDELKQSNRRYPAIFFKQEREAGKQILEVEKLGYTTPEGETLFSNITFHMNHADKITLISRNSRACTTFYQILIEELQPTAGSFKWGQTIKPTYLPNENHPYFANSDLNLVDWLRQYSVEKDEAFIRGFLGRMLFSGEETQKSVSVLSGGEKVRCMLSRMMLQQGNVLLLDEPTNHLDLEAITAFNSGLKEYGGMVIFTSRDHAFTETLANRVIELTPNGIIDKLMDFDEYITNPDIKALREQMYA
ncbi:ABC-F family ATPase [Sphingobacteriales bacterium UPWRP_1]|nr:ABC-F family ATPase [Sphingobacteriales bacterium TSM_CSS]PSJ78719.1 ABC-F family ATPase [Sphingobacteriales bacterium UPWRP_1]